jgi:K(+)-stimulated pyrophosphate-energized sodium pump
MNILIKLTCLIGLVIAPILGGHGEEGLAALSTPIPVVQEVAINNNQLSNIKDIAIQKSVDEATGMVTAKVTIKSKVNGATVTKTHHLSGTKAEVDAKIAKMDAEASNFK